MELKSKTTPHFTGSQPASEMTQPGNFSWFVEGRLAGMRYPRETDIAFLARHGVKTLVNLTGDDYYSAVAEAEGIKVHTIYIPDFTPPTLEQIKEFLGIVDAAEEVHIYCRPVTSIQPRPY